MGLTPSIPYFRPEDLPEGSPDSEDESDLGPLKQSDIGSLSVTGTDWTTETILSQMVKGNIELNPRFQRRDAWEVKRKSSFIESVILGLPVPQIVLAERNDVRGKYIVLDGKQRLLCLRRFAASSTDQNFKPFKLADLEIRPDLNGLSFGDMLEDLHFRNDVAAFENQAIRTVVVRNWRKEALLFHVFLRLNTGSKPLSPQELRQALHPGPFLDFVDEGAFRSLAIREIFRLNHPDFRMRDVELLIRYFSFRHRLVQYRGNLKEFLDDSCAYFNANWSELASRFDIELLELDEAHRCVQKVFGPEFRYGKWLGERFEQRFNRAVFDVVIAAFISPKVRVAILDNPKACLTVFQELCEYDVRFLESIERTTKSLDATAYRFNAWFSALSVTYGLTDTPLATIFKK